MKPWTQTLCCLTALAYAGCAGTIDDPAAFEDYAAQSRGESRGDAGSDASAPGEQTPGQQNPAEDAGQQNPAEDAGQQQPAPDTGAPSGGEDSGAPVASACDFKGLMQSACGSAGCHGGPTAPTGLDLTSDGLRGRLDGLSGSGPCADKRMIDDAAPEQSALYLMVTGSACGIRMPLGGSLNESEQACVLSWIAGP